MTSDFEVLPGIADMTSSKINDELAFTFPEVLQAIRLCTENEIAVLGVEVFEVRREGYATKSLSAYEREVGRGPEQREVWADYVRANNCRAEEFANRNPTGDEHVYVLTTASWKEYRELKAG